MKVVSADIDGLTTSWLQRDNRSADAHASAENEPPLLVFIHGCPDSPETWNAQFEVFGRHHQIVAPFLRGIGKSQMATNQCRYTAEAQAKDISKIIDIVAPDSKKKVVVICHDLGGPIGWNLARKLGQRLAGLICVNAPSTSQMRSALRKKRQLLKSWYIFAFQIPVVAELIFQKRGLSMVRKLRAHEGLGFEAPDPLEVRAFINMYRVGLRDFVGNSTDCIVTAPTLYLAGKKDPFLEVPDMEEFHRLMPWLKLMPLEGGHWLHESRPQIVNTLISGFLNELKH